jgi:hypothetical protein
MSAPADVQAPAGAVGWTPRTGFVYEPVDLPTRVTDGDYVLTVSTDGVIRGVTSVTTAPLVAQLRLETELSELVSALHDIAETFADRLAGGGGPRSSWSSAQPVCVHAIAPGCRHHMLSRRVFCALVRPACRRVPGRFIDSGSRSVTGPAASELFVSVLVHGEICETLG